MFHSRSSLLLPLPHSHATNRKDTKQYIIWCNKFFEDNNKTKQHTNLFKWKWKKKLNLIIIQMTTSTPNKTNEANMNSTNVCFKINRRSLSFSLSLYFFHFISSCISRHLERRSRHRLSIARTVKHVSSPNQVSLFFITVFFVSLRLIVSSFATNKYKYKNNINDLFTFIELRQLFSLHSLSLHLATSFSLFTYLWSISSLLLFYSFFFFFLFHSRTLFPHATHCKRYSAESHEEAKIITRRRNIQVSINDWNFDETLQGDLSFLFSSLLFFFIFSSLLIAFAFCFALSWVTSISPRSLCTLFSSLLSSLTRGYVAKIHTSDINKLSWLSPWVREKIS